VRTVAHRTCLGSSAGEIREWLKAERDISGKRRDAGKEVRCLRSAEADSPGTQTDTY